MRLDRIDPAHRHDLPTREVLTGLSSNTVALAIAWLEPRAEPVAHCSYRLNGAAMQSRGECPAKGGAGEGKKSKLLEQFGRN
jgi:hypothetical protein